VCTLSCASRAALSQRAQAQAVPTHLIVQRIGATGATIALAQNPNFIK